MFISTFNFFFSFGKIKYGGDTLAGCQARVKSCRVTLSRQGSFLCCYREGWRLEDRGKSLIFATVIRMEQVKRSNFRCQRQACNISPREEEEEIPVGEKAKQTTHDIGTQRVSPLCHSREKQAEECLNIGSVLISILHYIKLSLYSFILQRMLTQIGVPPLWHPLELCISLWNEVYGAKALFHLDGWEQRRINGRSSVKSKQGEAEVCTGQRFTAQRGWRGH